VRLYGEPNKVEKCNRKNFDLNETVCKWLIAIWFKCFTNRFRGETIGVKLLEVSGLSVPSQRLAGRLGEKWFESGFGWFFILVQ